MTHNVYSDSTVKDGKDKGKSTVDASKRSLNESDLPVLSSLLDDHSLKWGDIGMDLGFRDNELNSIQSKLQLLDSSSASSFRTTLEEWLKRAPALRDARGSYGFATLIELKNALRRAGLTQIAEELHVDQFVKETSEYYIIHVKLNHIIIIKLTNYTQVSCSSLITH